MCGYYPHIFSLFIRLIKKQMFLFRKTSLIQPLFPKSSYLEVLNREATASKAEISWVSTTCRRLCFFSQLQHDFPWDFTILAAGRGQCATLSTAPARRRGGPMRSHSPSVTKNVNMSRGNILVIQFRVESPAHSNNAFQWRAASSWLSGVSENKNTAMRFFNISNEFNSLKCVFETLPL